MRDGTMATAGATTAATETCSMTDVDLVAIGNYEAVKRAIDAGTGNNIVSNTELMRQVSELEGNNVWAVGRFDALATTVPYILITHITVGCHYLRVKNGIGAVWCPLDKMLRGLCLM